MILGQNVVRVSLVSHPSFIYCQLKPFRLFSKLTILDDGPGSVVGIATDYGLDGPGIESRCGGDFPYLSRPALRPTQPPVQ